MSKPLVLKKKKDRHSKAPCKREGKRTSFATADPNPGFPSFNKLKWAFPVNGMQSQRPSVKVTLQTQLGETKHPCHCGEMPDRWWLGKKCYVQLYTSEQTIMESLSLSIVGWKRVLDLWVWRSLFPNISQMFSRNMQLVNFCFFPLKR